MTNTGDFVKNPAGAAWRKSTHSGGHNECVEVATNLPTLTPVRDSKRPAGPVLGFTHDAWRTFVMHIS